MLVYIAHGSAGVTLWPTCSPTDHLSYEILESSGQYPTMRFVHLGVRIKARIDHDPLDQVINHGGDAIHATEAFVEAEWIVAGRDNAPFV